MYCSKCEKNTDSVQCKFMKHNAKCSTCGHCPDCEAYEKQVMAYHQELNEPDYFFEQMDEFDSEEYRMPRQPKERLTAFPSPDMEIVYGDYEIVSKRTEGVFIHFNVTFTYPVFKPLSASKTIGVVTNETETILFPIIVYSNGKSDTGWMNGHKLYEEFKGVYTHEAMEIWENNLIERLKHLLQPK